MAEDGKLASGVSGFDNGPVARAIIEAIDSVAAPKVRDQILHRALHMAREHELPKTGERLHRFVERHLRKATSFYLGNEAAESVLHALEPVLRLAKTLGEDGGKRLSDSMTTAKLGQLSSSIPSPQSQPSSSRKFSTTKKYPTMQPSGSSSPMVLIASKDALRCERVQKALEGDAAVQQIEDVVGFLDNIQATSTLSPLVVIDCMEAAVQPATLAALTHELPKDSPIILWGASETIQRDLADLSERDSGWLRCDTDASPEEVAALIRMHLSI